MTRFACVFAGLALIALPAQCQNESEFTVRGLDGTTAVLTKADLAQLPQHRVETTNQGTKAVYECVRLADVLAKVKLPLGEKFHSTAASYYVFVEAADGYRVVFAWAELDAGFMDKPIYVAFARDGKPLQEKAGVFQLVVPGEKRGARWLRQLRTVSVRQAN